MERKLAHTTHSQNQLYRCQILATKWWHLGGHRWQRWRQGQRILAVSMRPRMRRLREPSRICGTMKKTVMVRYRLATFSIKESNKKIWNLKTNKLMMSDITEDITYDSSCHLNPPTQVKSTLRLSQVLYIKWLPLRSIMLIFSYYESQILKFDPNSVHLKSSIKELGLVFLNRFVISSVLT